MLANSRESFPIKSVCDSVSVYIAHVGFQCKQLVVQYRDSGNPCVFVCLGVSKEIAFLETAGEPFLTESVIIICESVYAHS